MAHRLTQEQLHAPQNASRVLMNDDVLTESSGFALEVTCVIEGPGWLCYTRAAGDSRSQCVAAVQLCDETGETRNMCLAYLMRASASPALLTS